MNDQNYSHHMSAFSFKISISDWAPPQTQLGDVTALSRPQARFGKGEGKG